MKKTRDQKILDALLTKMFKEVGLNWKIDKIRDFASEPEWYYKYTWTEEQNQKFIDWAVDYLRKKHKFSKASAEKEMIWFDLQWGWKIEQD